MNSANSIVFAVDDDASVREALANFVESVGLRVECFESAAEFLHRRPSESPACLVLDVRMPGLSGLDLQRMLARAQRDVPIIFISAHGDIPTVVRAVKAGAVDFLAKPFREEDLLDAISQALERDEAAKSLQTKLLGIRSKVARLTARQHQIMTMIVEGKLNKQIAAELGLSQNTVKVHRRNIMETMAAAGIAELVHMHMIEQVG